MTILYLLLVLIIFSCFALAFLIAQNVKVHKLTNADASYEVLKASVTEERKKLENITNRMEEYNRAIKFLEQKPDLESEEKVLKEQVQKLEQELINLRDEKKTLVDLQSKIDLQAKTLEELERDSNFLTNTISQLKTDKVNLEKDKKDLQEENKNLSKTKKDLEKDNETLETKIRDNEKTKKQIIEDIEALKIKKTELEKWMEKNQENLELAKRLSQEIAERKERLKTLNEDIENTEGMLSKTMEKIGSGLDRLNDMNLSGTQTLRESAFIGLKEPVFEENQEQPISANENIALETVADYLKQTGFEVPNRLLYAFHTSLKTSDMSSLTVMAGVSGTGKSALPKLYSEAMGICFQPLAVEPRWDSPRDLMGFFNYVTNRYEPTLLARALFQFQGGWDETEKNGFRPEIDLSQYMFMPMLDEMNLARIEYYFSEFLSKLEMRRLEPVLTQKNCRSVAQEIFLGYEGKEGDSIIKEAPIRLFANTNTLFVGTMNEDETTQSLSDKVIDRANVLYFGRPNKLQARPPAVTSHAQRGLLPLKVWNSWKKVVTDSNTDNSISEALTNLNKVLAGFNRPFAHRTYQAMLSYIVNYPNIGNRDPEDLQKQALADQIGMRIMPKLRGLDLSQHEETFNHIREIVKNLDDPLLLTAFNNACDRNINRTGFFEWSGFDWDK